MELSMSSEPHTFTDDLEKYIEHIEEHTGKNKTILKTKKESSPGVMIIGNLITEEKLWNMLSTMKLRLAADDLCISSRYFKNQVDNIPIHKITEIFAIGPLASYGAA